MLSFHTRLYNNANLASKVCCITCAEGSALYLCSYRITYSQEHSEDHESVSDNVWNSWCKHKVIAEQIEMLSDKDLCASGQNSLNLV